MLPYITLGLIVLLVGSVVLWINLSYKRHRARLTPEQRAVEDEIVEDRLNSW